MLETVLLHVFFQKFAEESMLSRTSLPSCSTPMLIWSYLFFLSHFNIMSTKILLTLRWLIVIIVLTDMIVLLEFDRI